MSPLDALASFFFRVTYWQWVTFFVAILLITRLSLSLTHVNYLGIDGGAYVLSALEVQGKDATNVGFARPLLAPGWLLVPFINAFGIDVGYKIWTSLFSVLPLLPVYLLSRDLAGRGAAAFAVAFFSVDLMQMEMMVTGSLPLIGFTCIGMAIWSIFRLTERKGEWLHFGILVASLGLLPYINQTSAGIAVILLPIAVAALWKFVNAEKGQGEAGPRQANIIFYVLPAAFLGFLIALGSLAWYLTNSPGNSELRFPGPILTLIRPGDTAWAQLALCVGLVYLLFKATKNYQVRTLGLLVGVLSVLFLFLSWDEAIINVLYRSRYMVGLLFYPGVAFLMGRYIFPLSRSIKEEWMIIFPMAAMWIALLAGQVAVFYIQASLKDMATAPVVEALDYAEGNKAIITNAYSLSHWVAAIKQVESPNTWTLEPSPFYKEQAIEINCLMGWAAECDAHSAAQSLNAGYILIDERWPSRFEHPVWGSPERTPWGALSDVPWLSLKFSKDGVKLWEIRGDYHAVW